MSKIINAEDSVEQAHENILYINFQQKRGEGGAPVQERYRFIEWIIVLRRGLLEPNGGREAQNPDILKPGGSRLAPRRDLPGPQNKTTVLDCEGWAGGQEKPEQSKRRLQELQI
ncbi:hypothetical protein B0H19DRAFT_1067747 [Mycena capillaripes]|nr:hypothetical protein B0H19DRAFT_1067747 [Mycena capillaripes]